MDGNEAEISRELAGVPWIVLVTLSLLTVPDSRAASQWTSSCPQEAVQIQVQVESSLELRTKLIPKGPRRAFRLEAIEQQLRFHKKSLQEKWHAGGLQVIFPAVHPRIHLLRVKIGTSAEAYEVGTIEHPDVKVENAYISGAIAAGHLAEGEPVERISYSAEWEGIACGKARVWTGQKTIAPLDPYLAFWLVPELARRLIRWEGHESEFRISPLFDSEFADIPDPFYAWYFWRPEGSGTDVHGLPYRSRDFLKAGANVMESSVRIKELGAIPPLALKPPKSKVLKATVIFGVIDAKRPVWRPETSFVPSQGGPAEWKKVLERLNEEYRPERLDRGSAYALDFLRNLHHGFDLESLSYEYRSEDRQLKIEGKMAISKTRLRLRFFFGPTDLLAGEPPRHWALAADALEHDDLVVYNGHSGLGENFRLSNIEANLKRRIKPRRDQILAVLSCYSYSYYSDFKGARQALFTGSDYTSARGGLGLLAWIDAGIKDAELPFTEPGDFIILRSSN